MNSAMTVGTTVLLGAFNCWTGRINGMFFFGRTVDGQLRSSEAGQAITRRYLTGVAVATVVAATTAWTGGYTGRRWLGTLGVLFEILAFLLIFARANAQVRELAKGSIAASREPVIQVALLEQPSYWVPGLAAILLPLAACMTTLTITIFLAAHGASMSAGWNALSDSMDGQAYSGILGMATGLLVASSVLLLLFRTAARLRTRMAQYTVRSSMAMEWIGAAILIALLACNRLGVQISRSVGKGVMFAGLAAAMIAVLWNQSRANRFVPPPMEVGGDDRWRWGLFYVDRRDPALFVQSRCGAGYTLNYGRMLAWPISLGLVGYVVAVVFFLPHHH